MTMRHKSFEILETKADGDAGEFTALVAVIGNVDRGGDRIMSGAFTKTIQAWRDSGDPFPIILSHQWNDVMAHIGIADPKSMREVAVKDGTKAGGRTVKRALQLTGKLDIEDNPIAKQVYRLLKRRSLKEFSIGYGVPTGGEAVAEDGANELSEIDLVEAGPTLKGLNPATELLAVKSALGVEDEEPRSEDDQRKALAQLERDRVAQDLPEAAPSAPEEDPLEKALEGLREELGAIREELKPKAEPRAEGDLRKEHERHERDQIDLPDAGDPAPPEPSALEKQLEKLGEKLDAVAAAAVEAARPSEQELRKRADQQSRERVKAGLPSAEDPAPSPVEQILEATREQQAVLATALEGLTAEVAKLKADPPPDEGELRRASERVEREAAAKDLPEATGATEDDPEEGTEEKALEPSEELKRLRRVLNVDRSFWGKRLASDLRMQLDAAGSARYATAANTWAYVDDFDPDQGWVVYYVCQEGGTSRFMQVDYAVETDGSVTLADTDTEVVRTTTYRPLNQPKAEEPVERRPVDPLRKRSDQAVLEIESDGASLRKPPKKKAKREEPAPEPPTEAELRRASREVMLTSLTGGTT